MTAYNNNDDNNNLEEPEKLTERREDPWNDRDRSDNNIVEIGSSWLLRRVLKNWGETLSLSLQWKPTASSHEL